jgi:hypothetical protein
MAFESQKIVGWALIACGDRAKLCAIENTWQQVAALGDQKDDSDGK